MTKPPSLASAKAIEVLQAESERYFHLHPCLWQSEVALELAAKKKLSLHFSHRIRQNNNLLATNVAWDWTDCHNHSTEEPWESDSIGISHERFPSCVNYSQSSQWKSKTCYSKLPSTCPHHILMLTLSSQCRRSSCQSFILLCCPLSSL